MRPSSKITAVGIEHEFIRLMDDVINDIKNENDTEALVDFQGMKTAFEKLMVALHDSQDRMDAVLIIMSSNLLYAASLGGINVASVSALPDPASPYYKFIAGIKTILKKAKAINASDKRELRCTCEPQGRNVAILSFFGQEDGEDNG